MRNLIYLSLFICYLSSIYQLPRGKEAFILQNPVLTFGLIITGAALSTVLGGRFTLTAPRFRIAYGQSLLGGILMGLGLTIASLPMLGNVLLMTAGVFYWSSFLLIQGFIYLFGMLIGGGTAVFLIKYGYPKLNLKTISTESMQNTVQTTRRILIIAVLLLIGYLVQGFIANQSSWLILVVILVPVLGGFLLEKNRICMALMMKEIFLTGRFLTFSKVVFVIIAMLFFWQSFGIEYRGQLVSPTWLSFLGAVFMGFGYIIADGCFLGSLWKAGQGNILSYITLVGVFLGGAFVEIIKRIPNPQISKITIISTNLFEGLIWQEAALKIGITIVMFTILTIYFIDSPAKIKARGTSWKWLLSDAGLALTIGIIIKTDQINFPNPIKIMGTIIFYLSIILYCWARIELGKYWSQGIVLRENHELINTGPYKWLKHPIYWSVFMGVFGGCIMLGSIWGMAALNLLVGPTLYIRAKEEERLLSTL